MAAWPQNSIGRVPPRHRGEGSEPRWNVDAPSRQAKDLLLRRGGRINSGRWEAGSKKWLESPRIAGGRTLRFPGWALGGRQTPFRRCFGPIRSQLLLKIRLFQWHWIARGLLHSRSAFGIGLPLTASVRRHLGCGCSSVVEHDLAKVGVEGSSPFARSRFSSMANHRIIDRPPFGGLVVFFVLW